MTTPRRVQQQPAYLLHHRPFRDSSQILDIVTRDHGKIALVARGSRGSKSRLAGVLRPFLPLNVSWVARSDLGTLTGAEAAGPPVGIRGDGILSAFYVNELLLNFLHRHDPQPEIFALYREVISVLGSTSNIAVSLRSFELELLSLLGYAVNFRQESGTQRQLDPEQHYDYRMEQGPVPVGRTEGPMVFSGAALLSVQSQEFDDPAVLRAANRLLRAIIAHHLGGKKLKSRKVLMELHRGRIATPDERNPESE
ncbi:MAG: DNA repair protein RecO [Gammaproteobacteria bacterium]|nr:DNA repair protein RecO [Gammaproteobacteria bacterium]MBU2677018.1 DNA repair protein RecO [Gammaproteobacteria bacterium]NNC56437.1 DNA repair protein RecO [Woeseiaceae bacterium]NNL50750.1 DNA repair protein RecO [Woeseiaceae bacterium]